ncbi:S-adenosylmethionine-dependent methyltransferase Rv2258c-like [Antedon mediterranea]|uniref:S-adenosylmethionine-dependent methyltransferase Rv2258c-like n=1 Tax=Antedon mediterranea TaxID=105859 RepID=UPI003AF63C65
MEMDMKIKNMNMNNNGMQEGPMEFAQRLMGMINGAAVTIAISLGSETGLFKVMTGLSKPKTSEEIAKIAGLKERYVREWLASMVVSRIVEMDEENGTYYVPPYRRPFLEGPKNTAGFARMIPMLCEAYDSVADCFQLDGPNGVSYSRYGKFHHLMDFISNCLHSGSLIPRVLPQVPGMLDILEQGGQSLDVGCGRGKVVLLLAQRFPKSRFYGIDISRESIEFAKREAEKLSLDNAEFYTQDATQLPSDWSEKFDYVTSFDAIHDMPKPYKTLSEIKRILKPGGYFSMLEVNVHSHPVRNIGNPRAMNGYVISLMHCMAVSLNVENGAGLGIMWGKEEATKTLERVGFSDITLEPTPDRFNCHYISKKKVD